MFWESAGGAGAGGKGGSRRGAPQQQQQAQRRGGKMTAAQAAAQSSRQARAAQGGQRSGAGTDQSSAAFGAALPASMRSWCKEQMRRLNGSDDVTLMDFCMTLKGGGEVREYLSMYLVRLRRCGSRLALRHVLTCVGRLLCRVRV